MTPIQLPVLFKRDAKGKVQQWIIRVEPHDDGTATIITSYGKVDGAMQEARDHITQGKNAGRKNATTPAEQAVKEAQARWQKQKDRRHYGESVQESDGKIALAPMRAEVLQDHLDKIDWTDSSQIRIQPKFDGHRCLAIIDAKMQIKLMSRGGEEIVTAPHIVEQLRSAPPNTIIDGELYIHGVPLNKIGSFVTRAQPESAQLCYMIYDVVDTEKPFVERFDWLRRETESFIDEKQLFLSKTVEVSSLDDAYAFRDEAIGHGYEGAILRHGRAGYRSGKRSPNLLKLKMFEDADFTVVGYKPGRGPSADMAVFECVTDAGYKFDVLAPGSHAEKRAYLEKGDQYIGKRLTTKYAGYTQTEEPVPFQPVAKNFADAPDPL